jgi:polyhydroxyalkanoate synthesis regulator phasin
MRAEHDARRKMAMRILDMLDSEERLAKVKDADSQARAEGLEARIANISERIWGDVFGKAA